jgi:hypothetical protein
MLRIELELCIRSDMCSYISYFCHCCDQITDRNNSREELFILIHDFRRISPSWQRELTTRAIQLLEIREQRKGRV